jgi:ABC-2 type transport system permease protein
MTALSPPEVARAAAGGVPAGRALARTCAAEWARLWTVTASWWLLLAAAVVMLGLGTALGFGSALVLPLGDAPDMVVRVGFVLVAGTALAVGLGFLLRSTGGAMVSVFRLLLVLPGLLPQFGYAWLTAVADATPGAGAVFLLIGEPGRAGSRTRPPPSPCSPGPPARSRSGGCGSCATT